MTWSNIIAKVDAEKRDWAKASANHHRECEEVEEQ